MWNWVAQLEALRQLARPLVLITITRCSGSTPRETGAKMIVLEDRTIFGTIGGGHFEELAIRDALVCLEKNESQVFKYPLGAKTGQCCGGVVEVLVEVLNNGPILYLFGVGHVGQALCRVLEGTPFTVVAIDDRDEWINSTRIPGEVLKRHGEWKDFVQEIGWDSRKTYVAVMTHRHDRDQEIIEYAIRRDAAYIGLIGSQSKWARFRQRLLPRGLSEAALARVKCPIGIATGGKAPQEIAISIGAELLKVYYNGLATQKDHSAPPRRGQIEPDGFAQRPASFS